MAIFNSYYVKLILISIVALTIFYGIKFLGFSDLVNPYIWFINIVALVIAVASHAITALGFSDKTELHIFSMAGMGIRFFLSLIFIFIAVFVLQDNIVSFVLNFFILYLLYTSFEIYFLLCNLRPDSKKDEVHCE